MDCKVLITEHYGPYNPENEGFNSSLGFEFRGLLLSTMSLYIGISTLKGLRGIDFQLLE